MLVGAEAHLGEMRRERKTDQPSDSSPLRFRGSVGDEWKRVLHPYEYREPKLCSDRVGLRARDRRERRASDRSVTTLQLVQRFARRLAATADVRVVLLDAGIPVRAAVRHA